MLGRGLAPAHAAPGPHGRLPRLLLLLSVAPLLLPRASSGAEWSDVQVSGDERLCFGIEGERSPPATLHVDLQFAGEPVGGRVLLDGGGSKRLGAPASRVSFGFVSPGVHELALELDAPAVLRRLVLSSPAGRVRAADCGAAGVARPAPSSWNGLLEPPRSGTRRRVHLPAGTELRLVLEQAVGPVLTPEGSSFVARSVEDLRVDGRLALAGGTRVRGHVIDARAASLDGRGVLVLALDELLTPSGAVPLSASWVDLRDAQGSAQLDPRRSAEHRATGSASALLGTQSLAGRIIGPEGRELRLGPGTALTVRVEVGLELLPLD